VPLDDLIAEARRDMTICNACRYCEGHCAVFPAMELRTAFSAGDLRYLANLCHGCGSCFHHCPYAPPHEFAVDVPRVFAELRTETYMRYAWPGPLASLFRRNALAVSLVAVATIIAVLLATLGLAGQSAFVAARGAGAFYRMIPHHVMVALFGATGFYVAVALAIGFVRFWRDAGDGSIASIRPGALVRASRDMLVLRYLGGGGGGCTYPGEAPSQARRLFHHLTFYGFLFCTASTCVAAIYHELGLLAPYAWWSVPVALGTLGGLGLVAGPIGLLALKARSDPPPGGRQLGMDVAFAVLLLAVAATGFLLLLFRSTPAMGLLLAIHLGSVLGLFLTLPYGKFVHAIYRFGALVRHAGERERILR